MPCHRACLSSDAGNWRELQFRETVYSAWIDRNYDFNASSLRLGYSSLVQPKQILGTHNTPYHASTTRLTL